MNRRGNCYTYDEVVGGFRDAGDHVMFGLPQSHAASTLDWAYYEYSDVFEETNRPRIIVSSPTTLRSSSAILLSCMMTKIKGYVTF